MYNQNNLGWRPETFWGCIKLYRLYMLFSFLLKRQYGCIFKTTNTTCTTNTTWTANNQGWRYEKGSLVFTAESISRNYECFRGNIKELPICNLLVCLNNNFLRKKLIQNNTIFRNNHYICIRVGAAWKDLLWWRLNI